MTRSVLLLLSNVRHLNGSPEWQMVPDLAPAENELLIHKQFNSSFEQTLLEQELAKFGAPHIVLAGAETNWCIRATAYGALDRGYDLTLIKAAHTIGTKEIDGLCILLTKAGWPGICLRNQYRPTVGKEWYIQASAGSAWGVNEWGRSRLWANISSVLLITCEGVPSAMICPSSSRMIRSHTSSRNSKSCEAMMKA